MGNNPSIERSTRPRSMTAPQQAQHDHPIFADTEAGITIGQIPSYGQQPPGSPPSSILTPAEMSALGPAVSRRLRVGFGNLIETPTSENQTIFSVTLTGIGRAHPLAQAVRDRLKQKLQRLGVKGGHIKIKGSKNATISFRFDNTDKLAAKARKAHERTRNLVVNLQSLALGPKTTASLISTSDIDWWDLSVRSPWHLPKESKVWDLFSRRQWIQALGKIGAFDAAVLLLSDLAKVDDDIGKDVLFNARQISGMIAVGTAGWTITGYEKVNITAPDIVSAKDPSTAVRAFKETVCSEICNNLGTGELLKAGKIVLRDIITVERDCSELQPYQVAVFKNIVNYTKILSPEQRSGFLRDLFDLPDIDRADLFRNPKTRFLLLDEARWGAAEYCDASGEMTRLRDDFEKIDKHYHEIFNKRRERLGEKFVFDFNSKGQLEILARSPYMPLSTKSIKLLLEMADAACIIGREEAAIAVLEFLAPRPELSETQRESVRSLRDRIHVTVRFHVLRDKAAKFDEVKKQTDAIIAQAFGEQKPDPGV